MGSLLFCVVSQLAAVKENEYEEKLNMPWCVLPLNALKYWCIEGDYNMNSITTLYFHCNFSQFRGCLFY